MNRIALDSKGAAITSRTRFVLSTVLMLAGFPLTAMGGICDAYFPFDGNLADQGGNGYDGTMISKEGMPALARFAGGIDGQSLQLDGRSAMRAYLDLMKEIALTRGAYLTDSEVEGLHIFLQTLADAD